MNQRYTPEYRYSVDPDFKALVDYMENMIRQASYTPSEMREAALLACIRFEMRRPVPRYREVPGSTAGEGKS